MLGKLCYFVLHQLHYIARHGNRARPRLVLHTNTTTIKHTYKHKKNANKKTHTTYPFPAVFGQVERDQAQIVHGSQQLQHEKRVAVCFLQEASGQGLEIGLHRRPSVHVEKIHTHVHTQTHTTDLRLSDNNCSSVVMDKLPSITLTIGQGHVCLSEASVCASGWCSPMFESRNAPTMRMLFSSESLHNDKNRFSEA